MLEDEGVQARIVGPFRRGLRPPRQEGPRGRLDGALRLVAALFGQAESTLVAGLMTGMASAPAAIHSPSMRFALHEERVLEDGLVEHVASPAA